jgi:hypothetical protein
MAGAAWASEPGTNARCTPTGTVTHWTAGQVYKGVHRAHDVPWIQRVDCAGARVHSRFSCSREYPKF